MPIPKPETPEDVTIKGESTKRLITVVKPYKKDIPDILEKASELAKKATNESAS